MNPSDQGITFCDVESFAHIADQVGGRYETTDGVYSFRSTLVVRLPETLREVRYLDQFRIVFDPTRPVSDLAPERALFDRIASEYNSDVDSENNINTAEALLKMIAASDVIDLGCGTGLALQAPSAVNCELVGIDTSDHMLDLARVAGMRVCHLNAVDSLPAGSFDGLISCYALHLHGPRLALVETIALLSERGRVAANFHKGIGYSEVSTSLASHGFGLVEKLHLVDGLASPVAMWERDA